MKKQMFLLVQLILVLNVFVHSGTVSAFEVPSVCINPNGNLGKCLPLKDCPVILRSISTNPVSGYDFARKSECMSNPRDRRPYFCCTSDTGFSTKNVFSSDNIIFPDDLESYRLHYNSSLFPKPPVCGSSHISNRILGNEEAELGEFPWLALLEYETETGTLVNGCAGNIINQRYVLTAAHCVFHQSINKNLVSLIVGVHNKYKPLYCNKNRCVDVRQRFNVAEAIVHSGFHPSKTYEFEQYFSYNDIALLRTDRNIQYSIYVAPVCLPNVFLLKPILRNGVRLSIAGWGRTEKRDHSNVKLKVELPYIENEVCNMNVAPEQLCAGGELNKDSCRGDSGGGLVRFVAGAWIVEGLASYGRGCGLRTPGVYTRVSSYISWIYANVR